MTGTSRVDDPRMRPCRINGGVATLPNRLSISATGSALAKNDSIVDIALLEHCIREDLNSARPRRMAVLQPLKVVILNYPEGQVEQMHAINNPEDLGMGSRKAPFSRVLYIERDDSG